MPNTPAARDARKDARIWCPSGSMPSTWNELTNAEKAQFSLEDRERLRVGEFWWAPIADHGVYNSYANHFCRCPLCQQANATNKSNARMQNRMRKNAADASSQ